MSVRVHRRDVGPTCRADWNLDGSVDSVDLFDFLKALMGGSADFNADGGADSVDLFDFLLAFLGGC